MKFCHTCRKPFLCRLIKTAIVQSNRENLALAAAMAKKLMTVCLPVIKQEN